MPSLRDLTEARRQSDPERHDLLEAFERAKERRWLEVPGIGSDFGRAANFEDDGVGAGGDRHRTRPTGNYPQNDIRPDRK